MTLPLYNLLIRILTPLILLRQLVKSLKEPGYRQRLPERLGYCPKTLPKQAIWIHAVSVGETVACVPLVAGLRKRYPQHRILITTMTPSGSEQVKRSFGDSVDHAYLPYDLPGAMRRFIGQLQPYMCVIIETELWPNMIGECARNNVPTALVNARLSEKSARGYARIPRLVNDMFAGLTIVAAQSDTAGDRFLALGLDQDKLHIGGSIKFDCILDDVTKKRAVKLRKSWDPECTRPIWIAASTHKGEEAIILDVHKKLMVSHPDALLVLVPRHRHRMESVYKLCQRSNMTVIRRSRAQTVSDCSQVVLGDTIGELSLLYGACDLAFVGGSLVPRGGHNMIEPAAWGLPIVCGTNTFNFPEVAAALSRSGGQHCVHNAQQLLLQLERLLPDVSGRRTVGEANRALVASHRGAVEKQLSILDCLISDAA